MSEASAYQPVIRDANGRTYGYMAGTGLDPDVQAVLREIAERKAREKPRHMMKPEVCEKLGADPNHLEGHPAFAAGFPKPEMFGTDPCLVKVLDRSAPEGYRLEVYWDRQKVESWFEAFAVLAREFVARETEQQQQAQRARTTLKAFGVIAFIAATLQTF